MLELVVDLGDVGEDAESVGGRALDHVLGVEQLGDAKVFLGQLEGHGAVAARQEQLGVSGAKYQGRFCFGLCLLFVLI